MRAVSGGGFVYLDLFLEFPSLSFLPHVATEGMFQVGCEVKCYFTFIGALFQLAIVLSLLDNVEDLLRESFVGDRPRC